MWPPKLGKQCFQKLFIHASRFVTWYFHEISESLSSRRVFTWTDQMKSIRNINSCRNINSWAYNQNSHSHDIPMIFPWYSHHSWWNPCFPWKSPLSRHGPSSLGGGLASEQRDSRSWGSQEADAEARSAEGVNLATDGSWIMGFLSSV